jgi:hypothetical protein
MNNRARKITFPNVGIEQGSQVWRNSETGIEIIKGKNFAEVGLYYICLPDLSKDGRRMVDTASTLAQARVKARIRAEYRRDRIATDYTLACLEDSDRSVSSRTTHYRSPELGYQACGEMYSSDSLTDERDRVNCQRCRDRYNSAYWENATAGMARVPAF